MYALVSCSRSVEQSHVSLWRHAAKVSVLVKTSNVCFTELRSCFASSIPFSSSGISFEDL